MTIQHAVTVFILYTLLLLLLLGMSFESTQAQDATEKADDFISSLRFAGFLQQQFVADQNPDNPAAFSIKRARIGAAGPVTKHISLNVVGGFTEPPDNTPRLVNAFIDFNIHPLLQLRTGQFLLPFGLEGPEPIFLNPGIERSLAVRRLNTFTMFRDVGIQFSGKKSGFVYSLAVVNGAGANQNARIEPKDLIGRIQVSPVESFTVGVSGHLGSYQPVTGSDSYEDRTRAGADLSFDNKTILFRGEWQMRRDEQPTGGTVMRNGGYLLGGYRFSKQLETIGRLEYYDPDTSAGDDRLTAFALGANYYFLENTRLSVNYEFRTDRNDPNFSNQLTVQMQVVL